MELTRKLPVPACSMLSNSPENIRGNVSSTMTRCARSLFSWPVTFSRERSAVYHAAGHVPAVAGLALPNPGGRLDYRAADKMYCLSYLSVTSACSTEMYAPHRVYVSATTVGTGGTKALLFYASCVLTDEDEGEEVALIIPRRQSRRNHDPKRHNGRPGGLVVHVPLSHGGAR